MALRGRVAGAFVAGAWTALLAALLLALVSGGGLSWLAPSSVELAKRQSFQHSVAE